METAAVQRMEFQNTWNQLETILHTLDSPEVDDNEFETQLERFKLSYKNARRVECVRNFTLSDPKKNVSLEGVVENNFNEKRGGETLDYNVELLQELMLRQKRYRNEIEKIWKDFERYYNDAMLKTTVVRVPIIGGEDKVESMTSKPNVWEKVRKWCTKRIF